MREMKDSGIEWIGEIPVGWEVLRNKNSFTCTKELVGEKSSDTQLLSLTTRGVRKKDINNAEGKLPESFDTYQYVKENDIIMCLFDLDCSAVFSGISFYNGMISPAYRVLTCTDRTFPKYAGYWFNYISHDRKFNHYAKNIRYTLSYEEFSTLPIIVPPYKDQHRISTYLDTKCEKIDSIIARQQEVIEKLKAYKLSVITEAVTKGLNLDVGMKDSGVEWIGDVPQHWEISRIKYTSDFEPLCDKTSLHEESVITYTPMECIKNGWFINNIATLGSVSSSLKPYQNGDIVMAKVTPCFENGNIAIMENLSSGYGLGSSELFVFRPTNSNTKFLFYWLQNTIFKQMACSTMTGTGGLKRISSYFVKNCYIHFPPIEEQQQIADYLDKKCSAIDSAIAKKQTIIEKLTAYKKSLIYEVVTGKREV